MDCNAGNQAFVCVTTDYVEPNLEWERREYETANIVYRTNQLRNAGAAELVAAARDADALVVDQARISREVMAGLSRCRLILRHGDGYDNLDIEAATEAGIVCANEPGFWSNEVAEQALALALSLALKLPIQQTVAREGSIRGWSCERIMPCWTLGSRTVGIIGFGKTGALACKLFSPLVLRVLVNDPSAGENLIKKAGGTPAGFDETLRASDIVSIHIPATPNTIGLFNSALIGKMKRGAILVNVSRGNIVDTEALYKALLHGQLSGAGLDVTSPEPLLRDHPLFSVPNVIITPHMGWYSEEALWNMRRQIVADVRAMRDGKLPLSVVNPEVLKSNRLRLGSNPDK